MADKNNARLTDPTMLIQAGIDPKTGLPIKVTSTQPSALKNNIRKLIRIVDEQDALHRYTWYNLPAGLNGELIERVLYYRGQGMFFYMPANEQFFFLPYTLSGSIDCYGRYTGVTPVPFMGSTGEGTKDKPWINGLVREPIYELCDELSLDNMDNKCVLLSDYCKQMSQINIPRQQLQEPLIDVMADCIPFMRTALLNSTGIEAMRVSSQDEQSNVLAANYSIDKAALNGEKFIPVIGNVDFQNLTQGSTAKAEEFMLAMQSLDNFRLGCLGLENGGLFEKKAHELESENALNATKVGQTFQDGLKQRQEFCDRVNSIWMLGISCEPSETVMGDMSGDMFGYDDQDQSGMYEGEQPAQNTTEEEE